MGKRYTEELMKERNGPLYEDLQCASKWYVYCGIPHYETALEMQRPAESSGTAMPYALRFETDGRVSVVQHDVVQFLPCCEEPRGAAARSATAADQYKFALSLRCRLQLKCSLQDGCQVPEATRQKFKYRCPLATKRRNEFDTQDSNMPECDQNGFD